MELQFPYVFLDFISLPHPVASRLEYKGSDGTQHP